MKRLAVAVLSLALGGLLISGCTSESKVVCQPVPNSATICLNGKPIDFSREQTGPHVHENGNLYAPVVALAKGLGVEATVDAGGKSVTVNGKKLEVSGQTTVKGIHEHASAIFVPVKEFAAAAGLRVQVDSEKGTASFTK